MNAKDNRDHSLSSGPMKCCPPPNMIHCRRTQLLRVGPDLGSLTKSRLQLRLTSRRIEEQTQLIRLSPLNQIRQSSRTTSNPSKVVTIRLHSHSMWAGLPKLLSFIHRLACSCLSSTTTQQCSFNPSFRKSYKPSLKYSTTLLRTETSHSFLKDKDSQLHDLVVS